MTILPPFQPALPVPCAAGKDAAVQVVEGRGGLPTVTLKAGSGATAEVLLFGGCVISWKNSAGQEQLYIRPDAVFDKSKPVSGGIPHWYVGSRHACSQPRNLQLPLPHQLLAPPCDPLALVLLPPSHHRLQLPPVWPRRHPAARLCAQCGLGAGRHRRWQQPLCHPGAH